MIFVGLLLMLPVIANVVVIARTHVRRRAWTNVDATVTKVKERPDKSGGQNSSMIVVHYRFTDRQGQTRSGVDHRMYRKPRKNSTLSVIYDPHSPDINEPSSIGWVYGFLVLTVGAFVAGLWIVVSVANGSL
ncbi:DUF3592 domain-containing protein [Phytoactinopolyspora alkaliphila]|uniref:DUF3592 domain-containing protein n=1 Tax=Phytoactinopolyspora alkaliphila TaxID=1783498 RepID=A0A6N9YKI6_9ACTN|nr:DUF3592 domain-containing protein [Phytoactinopolyspora alkaliphila]